jgi:hypothetical protein
MKQKPFEDFKVNLRLSCHAFDWLLLIYLSLSKLFLQLKFSSCLRIVSLAFRWNSSLHKIRGFSFSFPFFLGDVASHKRM